MMKMKIQIKRERQLKANIKQSMLKESTNAHTPRQIKQAQKFNNFRDSFKLLQDPQKCQQLKADTLANIKECVNEISLLIITYSLVEKNKLNVKNNLVRLSNEVQSIFFNSMQVEPELGYNENMKKPMQLNNTYQRYQQASYQLQTLPISNSSYVLDPSLEESTSQCQIEQYRKTNIQSLSKIEQIYKLLQTLKDSYEVEKQRNELLTKINNIYSNQTDSILRKIVNKCEKEKGLTELQRGIQQIILKVKFEVYDINSLN